MARFFEEWPIHCCLYELDTSKLTKDDRRHLESRKRYYLDMMVWSNQIKEVEQNPHLTQTYRFMDVPASVEELKDSEALDAGSNHNHNKRLGFLTRLAHRSSNGSSPRPSTPSRGRELSRTKVGEDLQRQNSEDSFYSCVSEEETPRGNKSSSWLSSWLPRRENHTNSSGIEKRASSESLLDSRRARLMK